ncbi:hypothetical protein U9M48_008546 [Paspalum notatum var. saurae]|uniref:DDE Tnp4 domain-containing protein n=1 Tax=Paspalum notatum var. saurae TaxID=547442 RepID=A0AAQ3SP68_PASNO
MIACDFDLNITFISTGWEGSATDARVLRSAMNNGFHVPPGKFYLVDGGYANTPSFLAPYHGVRYHLITMFGRGSRKLNLMSKASKRKNSPKVRPTKDNGSTSSEKTRAAWNPAMEKTLVDLLHDHNTPEYRSQIGWKPKAWNKIVKEFHEKENHIAEGKYNFTSTQLDNPPEVIPDESDDETVPINLEERDEETTNEDEVPRTSVDVTRDKEPTNEDEGSTKQIESETGQSTKEKEDAQAKDFSIKRCISILNRMDVTKEEKVKAYGVFKNPDSREIFLSASDEDPKSAMMWLRNEMV